MFKFLHAADIHLDSPLKGLERFDGAPIERIRSATRHAFENLVRLAIDEKVAFVLLAGDLYDGDWRDYHTGLFFIKQMNRLRDAGIRAYVIAGNHDAANRMTKALSLPDNTLMLATSKPQSVAVEEHNVVIHGQGFARQAVEDDLSLKYPKPEAGCFNIGMLHTSADGRDGHARYAPCQLTGLLSKQYDYWALGHVHQREMLHEAPVVAFPGNVQGRHIRESGAKGCLIVSVDDRRNARAEFHPLDVFRWEQIRLEAPNAETPHDLLDHFATELGEARRRADQLPLAVRVEVLGPCQVHEELQARPERWQQEFRARALESSEEVWIEKVKFNTRPARDVQLPTDGPLGELTQLIDELSVDDTQLLELATELADLKSKLPLELKDDCETLAFDQPACMRRMLDQVKHLLIHRLMTDEVER